MPHIPDIRAHDQHDPERIAAYAAGDATGDELAEAIALVAGCPACAELHRDLRAIAAALPALPPPARTRDFRLTAEQAAALRPTGWRGVVALLAGPRFSLAAPLGTGLAALGLVGLLVGWGGLPTTGSTATGSAAEAASPIAVAVPAATTLTGPGGQGQPGAKADTWVAAAASGPPVTSEVPVPSAGPVAPGGPVSVVSPIAPPAVQAAGPQPAPSTVRVAASGPEVGGAIFGGAGAAPSSPLPSVADRQRDEVAAAGAASAASGRVEAPATEVTAPATGTDVPVVVGLLLLAFGAGLVGLRVAARRIAAS